MFRIFFFLLFVSFSLFSQSLDSRAQTNLGNNPNFDITGPGAKVIFVAPPEVLPPEVFTLPGAQTNFTQVCTFEEAVALVLDVPDKNKVEFDGPTIDMCDNGVAENLDQYINLDTTGEVTVRSDLLPSLQNSSGTITMRNLPFEEEPNIEVDGRPATDKDIENQDWDSASQTLTFKAKHFTTYKAVQASPVPSAANEEVADFFLDSFPILIIIVFVVIAIIIIGYLIRKRMLRDS